MVILVLRTSFAFAVFDEVLAITQEWTWRCHLGCLLVRYKKGFAPPFDRYGRRIGACWHSSSVCSPSPMSAQSIGASVGERSMRPGPWTRVILHIANLLVIAFFLLPILAALFGALQSEKSLHADTRGLWPPEWTLDHFRVILSGGAQRGKVFEQATYLPDNIKKIHYALINITVISVRVTVLTVIFASLTAYTVARLRLRWVMWLMSVNVFARFVPVIVLMIPLYVTFRQMGMLNSIWGVIIALTGFLLPLRHSHSGTVFRHAPSGTRRCRPHRWLLAFYRVPAHHTAAFDSGTRFVWRHCLHHRLE